MKTFLYHENGWRMFQAEALPQYPVRENDAWAYVDQENYNKEIAALKAKSILVGNPDAFINTQGYWIDTKVGSNKPKDDEFYIWPGDVEIKEEPEYPIDHTSYPLYRDVAYLKS